MPLRKSTSCVDGIVDGSFSESSVIIAVSRPELTPVLDEALTTLRYDKASDADCLTRASASAEKPVNSSAANIKYLIIILSSA